MADDPPLQPATLGGASPAALTVTTAVSMGAASVAPLVIWLIGGCPKPVPESVGLTIAALLIIGAHGAQKLFGPWLAKRLGSS